MSQRPTPSWTTCLSCSLPAGCAWSPISLYAAISRPSSLPSIVRLATRGLTRSTAATFLGTCDLTALSSGQLTPEEERAKVCTIVVGINVLTPLHKPYHTLLNWPTHNF